MKSEPDVYSIDQLKADGKTLWTGVRNYQARNFMSRPTHGTEKLGIEKPRMQIGDLAFFYHSNAKPPGIAGLAEIINLGVPDPTQFDPTSEYFDPKATKEKPIWFCAEVKFVKKFSKFLALDEIRKIKGCKTMLLLKKGSRLSISPVSPIESRALMDRLC